MPQNLNYIKQYKDYELQYVNTQNTADIADKNLNTKVILERTKEFREFLKIAQFKNKKNQNAIIKLFLLSFDSKDFQDTLNYLFKEKINDSKIKITENLSKFLDLEYNVKKKVFKENSNDYIFDLINFNLINPGEAANAIVLLTQYKWFLRNGERWEGIEISYSNFLKELSNDDFIKQLIEETGIYNKNIQVKTNDQVDVLKQEILNNENKTNYIYTNNEKIEQVKSVVEETKKQNDLNINIINTDEIDNVCVFGALIEAINIRLNFAMQQFDQNKQFYILACDRQLITKEITYILNDKGITYEDIIKKVNETQNLNLQTKEDINKIDKKIIFDIFRDNFENINKIEDLTEAYAAQYLANKNNKLNINIINADKNLNYEVEKPIRANTEATIRQLLQDNKNIDLSKTTFISGGINIDPQQQAVNTVLKEKNIKNNIPVVVVCEINSLSFYETKGVFAGRLFSARTNVLLNKYIKENNLNYEDDFTKIMSEKIKIQSKVSYSKNESEKIFKEKENERILNAENMLNQELDQKIVQHLEGKHENIINNLLDKKLELLNKASKDFGDNITLSK